jgi:aerobic carbon-monoxide dehydrogenase medium subunit
MRLVRPTTIESAVAALAEDPDARCLAGGQTLVAMMNADLLHPSKLISLRGIASLGEIATADGAVRIGAMATHSQVAAYGGFEGAQAIVREAAGRIAHQPIRNAGTIGGSVAHADPAADYPAALVAADAVIEAAGPQGRRRIAAADFFVDYLQSDLTPGEMVIAVHVPPAPPGAGHHYEKLVRIDGDYAIVSVAAVVARDSGGICTHLRLVAGACGATPIRFEAAEARLVGSRLSEGDISAALVLLTAATNPFDDFRGSAEYRQKVLPRLVRRAIARAGPP